MENDDFDYSEQKIIKDEELFRVHQKDLLQTLTHSCIAAITFLNSKKKSCFGSGAMISKDLFLTVAHNIYNRKEDCEYNGFKIYVGADGTAKEFFEIEGWRYDASFKNKSATGNERLKNDYALIKLKRPVNLNKFLQLALPCELCLMKQNNESFLQIFGFPGEYDNNYKRLDKYGQVIELFQYGLAMNNRIIAIEPEKFKISYAISTAPGQSGCPVVHKDTIISLHNGGIVSDDYNIGRLITTQMLTNIVNWGKELKGHSFQINEKNICEHVSKRLRQAKLTKQIIPEPPKLSKEEQQRIDRLARSRNPQRIPAAVKTYLQKNIDRAEIAYPGKKLQAIDLTKNIKMTHLYLYNNSLCDIDLRANYNLKMITLWNNYLSQIDLSNNINLEEIEVNRNSLKNADLSKNINVKKLDLSDNQLKSICLTNCVNLISLDLRDNKLVSIDLSSCVMLERVHLYINPLKVLDLSKSPKVRDLMVSFTALQDITFWYSSKLTYQDTFDIVQLKSQKCIITMLHREGELEGCKALWQPVYERYMEGKGYTEQIFKKSVNPNNTVYMFNPILSDPIQ